MAIMHIVLVLDEAAFRAAGLDSITESQWRKAGYPGFSYRIDAARPESRFKRHVHIAQTKHIAAKNKQVSWNDDLSRHDQKTFNASFKGLNAAKQIARDALGLPDDSILESASGVDNLQILLESNFDEIFHPDSTLPDPIVLRYSASE